MCEIFFYYNGFDYTKSQTYLFFATIENESDWIHIKVKPMSFQNGKLGNN